MAVLRETSHVRNGKKVCAKLRGPPKVMVFLLGAFATDLKTGTLEKINIFCPEDKGNLGCHLMFVMLTVTHLQGCSQDPIGKKERWYVFVATPSAGLVLRETARFETSHLERPDRETTFCIRGVRPVLEGSHLSNGLSKGDRRLSRYTHVTGDLCFRKGIERSRTKPDMNQATHCSWFPRTGRPFCGKPASN